MDERDDLRDLTVRALRELARKWVGAGYSRLRTKAELIAAILLARTERRAEPPPEPAPEPVRARTPVAPRPAPPPKPPKVEEEPAEPHPEGFMVARVGGDLHAAPHVLTEDRIHHAPPPGPVDDEGLGELPWSYGDDALVVLPRDPRTLWVYWDFRHDTVQEALRDLEDPRARMRVFAGDELVRDVDFALESRSFYLNDLPPGRPYRVEVLFVGRNGSRAIRAPSNQVALPPSGPSSIIDDRFVTLPWGMPLSRRQDLFARAVSEAELSDAEREALYRASGGGRPLGASERAVQERLWESRVPGGGEMSARGWSGSPYEKK